MFKIQRVRHLLHTCRSLSSLVLNVDTEGKGFGLLIFKACNFFFTYWTSTWPQKYAMHTTSNLQCLTQSRGGKWSFKNSGTCKILVEFYGSSSHHFQWLGVSESRFLTRLRVPKSQLIRLSVFIHLNDVFLSFDIEFQFRNLQISEKK